MSEQGSPQPAQRPERPGEEERPVDRPWPATPVAAEANLLRLPLFALQTRGLKTLDGFECTGTTSRDGRRREFTFRTARSTATPYPGPLSRSAHLTLLSLITERGLPLENPVTWTWRGMCRRLGVSPSGRTVEHLKQAIEATAGLTIYSRDAIYLKADGRALRTRKAAHLYETVVFVNEELPDGSVADRNHLWLSGWYLENLNALFTAPLDHELWRHLDRRSPIASRLYEFLLINFHTGTPQFRIHYPRLARFLPVRAERYLSDARRQLGPALEAIQGAQIVERVGWERRERDLALLRFDRGPRLDGRPLRPAYGQVQPASEPLEEVSLSVREVRRPPEYEIVGEFHRPWKGDAAAPRPKPRELELAREFVARYGRAELKRLLPDAVERLRRKWPDARTFVALEGYLPEVARERADRQRQQEERGQRRQRQRDAAQQAEQKTSEQIRFESHWLPVWRALPAERRRGIEQAMLAEHTYLQHAPHMLQTKCLHELARRQDGSTQPPAPSE